MIRSMTSFGRSRVESPLGALEAEVRCTNGRFFKLYPKLPPEFLGLERRIEQLCKEHIRRGSVDLFLRFSPSAGLSSGVIDCELAARYASDLARLAEELRLPGGVTLDSLVTLPGVVGSGQLSEAQIEELWPSARQAIGGALQRAAQMRECEGQALEHVLRELLDRAETALEAVAERAPQVAVDYRERVRERLTEALADGGIEFDERDLLREVTLFVERSDITEEVDRFRSHLSQFRTTLGDGDEMGKRLEFLTQELHREANTMGSKCSDAFIGEQIVELKTLIEKVREQVMNVE